MGLVNLVMGVLAIYAVAGAAAPLDGASGSVLAAPAEILVEMCDDKNFSGRCKKISYTTGICHNVPDSMTGRISAIRNVDKEKTNCVWYREDECRGTDQYKNQDDKNLGDGNGHFNDSIRSLKCEKKK
ncbi:hypothetical protein CTA2_9635 [Colletotrichum tanaceti]|uniref:Beta/gamma crystallin 'Greek key' domain-containing protein n=1 Tax=Colletotrichum tanaceti TaxID=1306861 RepID=A0A4U6XBX8_9PEZI|nr:hypothetical protein CTA2_9635 [Colletotrichum tanaceti]TKW53228.1 hypothetical protein CTA1_6097 [Colletotrichum tanaceti]